MKKSVSRKKSKPAVRIARSPRTLAKRSRKQADSSSRKSTLRKPARVRKSQKPNPKLQRRTKSQVAKKVAGHLAKSKTPLAKERQPLHKPEVSETAPVASSAQGIEGPALTRKPAAKQRIRAEESSKPDEEREL